MKTIKKRKRVIDMSKNLFDASVQKNWKILELYVPIVDRVHGEHHPEFHEVRALYEAMKEQLKAGEESTQLEDVFSRLRTVTDDYTVPGDTCESYEAVYNMLADLDQAWHA